MIGRYNRRPPSFEAVQFTGDNIEECLLFAKYSSNVKMIDGEPVIVILGTDDLSEARIGDYIVKDGGIKVYNSKEFNKIYIKENEIKD